MARPFQGRNVTFCLGDVWQFCEYLFAEIGEAECGVTYSHIQNFEQHYIETEGLMEPEVGKVSFHWSW
jgi:hypothetical protein